MYGSTSLVNQSKFYKQIIITQDKNTLQKGRSEVCDILLEQTNDLQERVKALEVLHDPVDEAPSKDAEMRIEEVKEDHPSEINATVQEHAVENVVAPQTLPEEKSNKPDVDEESESGSDSSESSVNSEEEETKQPTQTEEIKEQKEIPQQPNASEEVKEKQQSELAAQELKVPTFEPQQPANSIDKPKKSKQAKKPVKEEEEKAQSTKLTKSQKRRQKKKRSREKAKSMDSSAAKEYQPSDVTWSQDMPK